MTKKLFLQEFELLVLLAILRLCPDAYGAAIARELEETAERGVSIGALYATLSRLVDKGYLVQHVSDPLPVKGGRARKHYALTGAGEAAVTCEGCGSRQRDLARAGALAVMVVDGDVYACKADED